MPDINVREMGARGDGTGDDGPAFQKAFDSGRGPVAIPAGEYRIGATLLLGSGAKVAAHPDAHIVLADGVGRGVSDFLLANRDREAGNADITVEGGVWDGNARGNPRGPDKPESYTGRLINFVNVRNLSLRNLAVKDAESYFITLGEVRGFTVEGVEFRAQAVRPNQDGVHLGGFCEDGTIRDLRGAGKAVTNDDMVAMNADDILWRTQNVGLKCGPIRRIKVSGVRAEDCHTFVRLLSFQSAIEDIDIEGLHGGCAVGLLNMDAARKCRTPMFTDDDPRYARGVGKMGRVTVRNAEVWKTGPEVGNPLIDLMTLADGFSVSGFRRDAGRDRSPDTASLVAERVPGTVIELAGLDGAQLSALRAASRGLREEAKGDRVRFILEDPESVLRLPSGGFADMMVSAVKPG